MNKQLSQAYINMDEILFFEVLLLHSDHSKPYIEENLVMTIPQIVFDILQILLRFSPVRSHLPCSSQMSEKSMKKSRDKNSPNRKAPGCSVSQTCTFCQSVNIHACLTTCDRFFKTKNNLCAQQPFPKNSSSKRKQVNNEVS